MDSEIAPSEESDQIGHDQVENDVTSPPSSSIASDFTQPDTPSGLVSLEASQSISGNGMTTLELHPNVILGIGDDEEQATDLDRPHLCTICNARYKTRTHLRRHMFTHMNSRPFPCMVCDKGFNRREHLNKHIETVHEGNKKICPYCKKNISRIDHLRRHIKNMHSNKDKTPVKRPVLQMAYRPNQKAQISFLANPLPSIGDISQGQTIITPIPVTTSSACGKNVEATIGLFNQELAPSTSTVLQETSNPDIRIGDNPPLSMTIIPSNILGPSQQGIATLSIQSHQGSPAQKVLVHQRLPSTTEFIGLAELANLGISFEGQSMSDLGEKKAIQLFNCGKCGESFATEKELNLHSRSHTRKSQQSYECPDCSRVYTRREKLTEHIRCVHQGQRFDCEYCEKKFSRKDHVLRHMRSVHPEAYAAGVVDIDDEYMTLDEHGKLVSTRNPVPLVPVSPAKRRKGSGSQSIVGVPSVGDIGVLLRSVCQFCLKVFGTSYHLTRHIDSCHSGDVRPFSCTACNKMFKRKDHLTKHVKSHCPTLKEQVAQIPSSKEKAEESHQGENGESICNRDTDSGLGTSETSANSSDSHPNHTVLQNLQVAIDTSRNCAGSDIQNSTPITQGATLIVDESQHKHSDHNEFSLAVIDSFMQGNVNVVLVNQDISNFLQQSSTSHLTTTTFPCGQCQKEFHARDQLIAHLQEHAASESVLPNGPHLADISFADF